ncbi:MAG: hypothetical protein JRI44_08965 [Deltaproteobacteria bacterium]|nr:hypothetical protein [Deltaproteobacteria bacterium]
MSIFKSRVFLSGGSFPIVCKDQKSILKLEDDKITLEIKPYNKEKKKRFDIPLKRIKDIRIDKRKSYSTVSYFIIIEYLDQGDVLRDIHLQIRSFIRRGRTLNIANHWVKLIKERIE